MQKRTVVIGDEGLRSHDAALLVQTACKYPCRIEMEHGAKRVNAKSMMGALSLGMMPGELIICTAEGEQEKEALDDIERLIRSGFKSDCEHK